MLPSLPAETVHSGEPLSAGGESDLAALLVPDVHGHRRTSLLRALEHRAAVVGPARPTTAVRASLERALRVRALELGPDTEAHLTELVLGADPDALADLRAQALAPLADRGASSTEKLVETLRSWLLHHGRRDAVAADLFVHPQTVRYRMSQLREAYGERLDDPRAVLELTVALGTLDVAGRATDDDAAPEAGTAG